MFSTHEGARKRAKKLKSLLDDSGFEFPLRKCQDVVAKAGGYRDWHDLEAALGGKAAPRTVEPEVYERRLIRALPDPCVPPVLAMLDNQQRQVADQEGTPPHWWRDVFPYVFAIAVVHRSSTAILRPGSGAGQKLRENLVVGLILNRHGGHAEMPTLDPETLALHYRGGLETLFRKDFHHPRFEIELAALEAAGIIELRPSGLRIAPPDPKAVQEHVLSGWIGKAEHWAEDGGKAAIDALADVLSAIGVRNALRVADAIVQYGSDAFDRPAGPALELLSSLAEEGEVETFAKAVRVFEGVHPQSARSIRASIPAKISSLYLARHRGYGAARLFAYTNAHPDWAERLRAGAADPGRFSATVDAIAAEIEAG